jgi:hypothetical protein
MVECNVTLDLAGSIIERVSEFAIGKVITVKQKSIVMPLFKMYLYGRNPANESQWLDADIQNEKTRALESFSLHNSFDESIIADRGIKVTNEDEGACWMSMVKFFVQFNDASQDIVVNKKFAKGMLPEKTVSTIGTLSLF